MLDALIAAKYHSALDGHGKAITYAHCIATYQSYKVRSMHYHRSLSQHLRKYNACNSFVKIAYNMYHRDVYVYGHLAEFTEQRWVTGTSTKHVFSSVYDKRHARAVMHVGIAN